MNRIRSIRVLFCCAIGKDVIRLGIGVGSLLDLRQEDVAAHQRQWSSAPLPLTNRFRC